MTDIQKQLFALREEGYAAFIRKLIPTVSPETVIGVRTPALRKLAKALRGTPEAAAFLNALPHDWFEENQLHAFLLSEERDFDICASAVDRFLPFVDNWATCDQLSPKTFRKNAPRLLPLIDRWLDSDQTYTVRFGVGMLMQHFLDDRFDETYPARVAQIVSDEYYVNMMLAWYFATALAKQYDAVLPYLQEQKLPLWVHNKAIQKAIESFRVTDAHKAYLKTLRRKAPRGKQEL